MNETSNFDYKKKADSLNANLKLALSLESVLEKHSKVDGDLKTEIQNLIAKTWERFDAVKDNRSTSIPTL